MRTSVNPPSAAIAAVLAGSWRKIPPSIEISPTELDAVYPLLLQSGAGALTWWKLRHSGSYLLVSPLEALRSSYLSCAVHAVQYEQEVAAVCHLLRQSGIEAILLKGWAIGRLYAEPSLRPPGDIDLCVAPGQIADAKNLLDREGLGELNIDFDHAEISRFGSTFAELLSRSCLAELNGCQLRVLGAEDHLRVLCLHLLKHGAWRPLWLCDVAAALESRPPGFDWNLCLGDNQLHARWILSAVELARLILGASAGDVPRCGPLPYWLLPAVLRQWEAPPPTGRLLALPLSRLLQHPREAMGDIRRRWRNPIMVTVLAGAEFNHWPKFPLQAADGLARTFLFFARRHSRP